MSGGDWFLILVMYMVICWAADRSFARLERRLDRIRQLLNDREEAP